MKFALVFLVLASAAPSPEVRYFQFQRRIDLQPNGSGQACVVLDPQIFADAAPGLADVRLYRGSDATPYVIQSTRPSQPQQRTIAPINPGVRNGRTVFDADMPEGDYGDLLLNINARNFLASVTVTGSQTATGRPTRIGSWTIFDFSSQRLGRSTVLHLPRSNFRTLHFEIAGQIAPGKIIGIAVAPEPPIQPRYLNILSLGQALQRGRASVLEFNLPANVPVDRIAFTLPSRPENFSREVEVQALKIREAKEEARAAVAPETVASGNLLRIHREFEGRRIDEEHLALDMPQNLFTLPTKWTITIQNGDDPAIGFVSVQVEMLERNLCFETSAAGSYRLYYGDAALSFPRYDYAAWFSRRPDAASGRLGAEQANPAFQKRPDSRPFTERHPALLWVALLLMILLLGLVALRSARRVEEPAKMS